MGHIDGSVIFLIYINDLQQAPRGSMAYMYADDTSLCHKSHDMIQLNTANNNDLMNMDNWLQGSKLSLNVAKQALCLSPPNSLSAGSTQASSLNISKNSL